MSYQNQIVGTIISSVLDYDQLCTSISEPAIIQLGKSSYVPCDGRSIVGSELNKITGMANAPDLRGKFVRGLNLFYNVGQPASFDPQRYGDTDGANRIAGDYQKDIFGSHSHSYQRYQPKGLNNISNDYDQRDAADISSNTGDSTGAAGGDETRPRNIAVYFYIKIN